MCLSKSWIKPGKIINILGSGIEMQDFYEMDPSLTGWTSSGTVPVTLRTCSFTSGLQGLLYQEHLLITPPVQFSWLPSSCSLKPSLSGAVPCETAILDCSPAQGDWGGFAELGNPVLPRLLCLSSPLSSSPPSFLQSEMFVSITLALIKMLDQNRYLIFFWMCEVSYTLIKNKVEERKKERNNPWLPHSV